MMNRRAFSALCLMVPSIMLTTPPSFGAVGSEAPEFALPGAPGGSFAGRFRLVDHLHRRPVVVLFWATWCQPCAAENPIFAALARRYAGRVRFLSVIYQDTPEAIRAYERQRGSWGPALVDPDSRTAIQFGVYGVPETFLIDAQGVIREKVTGMVSFDGLNRSLETML